MNNITTLHIRQTADLLANCRVSQDGWAKVLERAAVGKDRGPRTHPSDWCSHSGRHRLRGECRTDSLGYCAIG